VNLIDHERVLRPNVVVLEPSSRNAGGDDHDVPAGRFGRCLAFSVDDAYAQFRRSEDGLGDRLDGKCLARARARDDAESPANRAGACAQVLCVKAVGQCP
jgi:hypothetical protein